MGHNPLAAAGLAALRGRPGVAGRMESIYGAKSKKEKQMKALFGLLMAAVFLLAALAPTAPARAESGVWVHFMVISKDAAGGGAEVMGKFQAKLAGLAGGYTYLGDGQGGYIPSGGKLQTEDNHSYIIAAPKNLSKELEALTAKFFPGQKPFILVWQGKSNY
jgi:hypothetical protein